MLRATIEIILFGDEARKSEIVTIEIANIGGDQTMGEYAVTEKTRGRSTRLAYVHRFPRRLMAAALVARAITALGAA